MERQSYNKEWDYKIDGKRCGLIRMAIMGVLAAVFIVLAADQFGPGPNKRVFVGIVFAFFGAQLLWAFLQLAVRYFCFRIYIGGRGFYFRTNPWNGGYYEYSEVSSCKVETVASHSARSAETYSYSYFTFSLKNGERKKARFEKSFHGEEIEVLKKRIDANA